ncbi:hypothetical protein NPIL_203731 [Nephila pilipes]|uniref:Uncharacterized protein n=1 Tax=Nephila pilipes TaxID=299642 RepID=A0A8X6US59_NEPPI|nr:hypothetical protein NPIL_203731 [Nephila pilipes]
MRCTPLAKFDTPSRYGGGTVWVPYVCLVWSWPYCRPAGFVSSPPPPRRICLFGKLRCDLCVVFVQEILSGLCIRGLLTPLWVMMTLICITETVRSFSVSK